MSETCKALEAVFKLQQAQPRKFTQASLKRFKRDNEESVQFYQLLALDNALSTDEEPLSAAATTLAISTSKKMLNKLISEQSDDSTWYMFSSTLSQVMRRAARTGSSTKQYALFMYHPTRYHDIAVT